MAEEIPKYYAVMTEAGAALEARALAEGLGIELTHIVIGDASMQEVVPAPDVKALVHEVARRPIEMRTVDEADANITNLHAIIPAEMGGFWVREMGIVGHLEGSDEEVLYAYANHAPYYKMLPQSGQTSTHRITIPILQSTGARLEIRVLDEGYATRDALEQLRGEFAALSCAVSDLARVLARLTDRLARDELGSLAMEKEAAMRELTLERSLIGLMNQTLKKELS